MFLLKGFAFFFFQDVNMNSLRESNSYLGILEEITEIGTKVDSQSPMESVDQPPSQCLGGIISQSLFAGDIIHQTKHNNQN